jgi:hypothetical protein
MFEATFTSNEPHPPTFRHSKRRRSEPYSSDDISEFVPMDITNTRIYAREIEVQHGM